MRGESRAGKHVFAPSGPAGSETVDLPELSATFDALDETRLLQAYVSANLFDSLGDTVLDEAWVQQITAPLARVALVQRDLRLLATAPDFNAALVGAAQLERAVLLAIPELEHLGKPGGLVVSADAAFRLLRDSHARSDIEDLIGDAQQLGLLRDVALPTFRSGFGSAMHGTRTDRPERTELPQLAELRGRSRITNSKVHLASDIAARTGAEVAEVVPLEGARVVVDFGEIASRRGVLQVVAFKEDRLVGEATLDLRRASRREVRVLEQPDHLEISLLVLEVDPVEAAGRALRSELHVDGQAAVLWDDTARAWLAAADDRRASLALRREAELVAGSSVANVQRQRADLLDPESKGRTFGRVTPPPRWRRLVPRHADG